MSTAEHVESAGLAGGCAERSSSRRCTNRVMLKPAETRQKRATVLRLLVAGGLLCGCGSGGVGPTPPPTRPQTPAAPVSVSQLSAAPRVADLAGRFAYGTDLGHIWVVDAATGKRTQVTHDRGVPTSTPTGRRTANGWSSAPNAFTPQTPRAPATTASS